MDDKKTVYSTYYMRNMHLIPQNTNLYNQNKYIDNQAEWILDTSAIPSEHGFGTVSHTEDCDVVPNIQQENDVTNIESDNFSFYLDTFSTTSNNSTPITSTQEKTIEDITLSQHKMTKTSDISVAATTTTTTTTTSNTGETQTPQKGASKSIEKTEKQKKPRRHNKRQTVEKGHTYRNFIHNIFVSVMKEHSIRSTISTDSINSLDNIAAKLITTFTDTAHKFVRQNKRKTIGLDAIRGAIRVSLKSPLTQKALLIGEEAVAKYKVSDEAREKQ